MTEITEINRSNAKQQFILYWGDMGNQWGVNRSVAQIHALLFLNVNPMNAEQISAELSIARSNVSNSLKELVAWKLIRRIPIAGDRREHFAAEADVREMASLIAKGRKEREIDPATAALSECVTLAMREPTMDPRILVRLQDMQDFLHTADHWFTQMLAVPKSKLNALMKMGDKVFKVLKLTSQRAE